MPMGGIGFDTNLNDFTIGPVAVPQFDRESACGLPTADDADIATSQAHLIPAAEFALPKFDRCRIWDVDFDCVTMEQSVDLLDAMIQNRVNTYAITANLNYLMLCSQNPRLAAFTQRCPLVLCDGKPIQLRSRLETNRLPERVAGSDLIYKLAELSVRRGYSIYMLGGADGVAAKAAQRLTSLYPGLRISGVHCPPFGNWNGDVRNEMNERIVAAKPDILLVAFGQPKGEFWIEQNYKELQVPISIQVGATFDFLAGNAQRAPKWMQDFCAEWLYRAFKDPRRLAPRYLANAAYLFRAVQADLLRKLA